MQKGAYFLLLLMQLLMSAFLSLRVLCRNFFVSKYRNSWKGPLEIKTLLKQFPTVGLRGNHPGWSLISPEKETPHIFIFLILFQTHP